MPSTNNLTIAEFFANQTVFITGTTGYIGRTLLEKILRCCPQVSKIYVIVRADKNGKSGEGRIRDMLVAPLYDRVRDENPDFFDKMVPIDGDVTFLELGLNSEIANILRKEVSVVIHSAASINFAHGLHNLVRINVGGTKNMLEWAKGLENLKAFVYISTAFSNTDRLEIEEKVYSSRVGPHVLIDLCSNLPSDLVESISPNLRGGQKLDYAFSKQLAETLVQESRSDLPVCIVRPALVGAAYKDPFPGWMDNVAGVMGAVGYLTRGLIRVLYTNKNATMDFVPVDYVVNLTLAAAMCRAENLIIQSEGETLVFNCSTSEYPILNGPHMVLDVSTKIPVFNEIFWYPSVVVVRSRRAFDILDYFLHYIPAVLLDGTLMFSPKKPKYGVVATYKRLKKLLELTFEMMETDFEFKTENVKNLFQMLAPGDQELFGFDISRIDHRKYLEVSALGIRRYALGGKDEDLPKARANLRRYYIASWTVFILILALIIGLIARLF